MSFWEPNDNKATALERTSRTWRSDWTAYLSAWGETVFGRTWQAWGGTWKICQSTRSSGASARSFWVCSVDLTNLLRSKSLGALDRSSHACNNNWTLDRSSYTWSPARPADNRIAWNTINHQYYYKSTKVPVPSHWYGSGWHKEAVHANIGFNDNQSSNQMYICAI